MTQARYEPGPTSAMLVTWYGCTHCATAPPNLSIYFLRKQEVDLMDEISSHSESDVIGVRIHLKPPSAVFFVPNDMPV